MYKLDLALDNLQWSICCKTKPNQTCNYLPTFVLGIWYASPKVRKGIDRLYDNNIVTTYLALSLVLGKKCKYKLTSLTSRHKLILDELICC